MAAPPSPYRHAGFFLLRTPALPASTFHRLTDDAALSALSGTPRVRRALEVASPSLGAALREGHEPGDGKRGRRIRSGLLRYLTRMSTRPTPYGAFAAVTMGEFGPRTTARLGAGAVGRQRIRADMGWLMLFVREAQQRVGAADGLALVWNALAHPSGERIVLPQADAYGQGEGKAARILDTEAVRLVRERTRGPVPCPYGEVVAELSAAFPDAPAERLNALIGELLDLGFLLSDLRPPLTLPHPEHHVAERLAKTAGTTAADLARELDGVAGAARHAETSDTADELVALRAAQRALVPAHRGETFHLDAAADLRGGGMTAAVGEAAADAVGVLARLADALPGPDRHLAAYAEAFMERYGTGALVPLTDVLSPLTGLDAPAGYLQPPPAAPPEPGPEPVTRAYERVLAEQLGGTPPGGAVELSDALEDRLVRAALRDRAEDRAAHGHGRHQGAGAGTPVAAVDVYLQVQAAGADAIDRGEWRLVLNDDGLAPGGCTFGRFFDLFDDAQRERLRRYARHRQELAPHAVVAELSYVPAHGRGANVAVRPLHHDFEIPVNVPPTVPEERVIALDDLYVAADHTGLFLWSRRLGREVIVAEGHMLTPAAAPNVCRFLTDVSRLRRRTVGGFTWAGLEGGPYLPRVVRGRVVLRAAEWTLTAGQLAAARPTDSGARAAEPAPGAADTPETRDALARWRAQWRVPRYVYLVEHDNRLLLDLDRPGCRTELLRELRTSSAVRLQEMLPGFDGLWLRDESGDAYVSELVVPLLPAGQAAQPAAPDRTSPRHAPAAVARPRHLPGDRWSCLKLYSCFDRHDEILAGPLRALADALRRDGRADRWFFIRYADPRPHLRIRFRAPGQATPAEHGALLTELLAFGRDMVRRGLAGDLEIASYEPEVVRYGGPRVHDAIERLFEAGSDTALQVVDRMWGGELDMRAEFVAVAVLDALYDHWGLDVRARFAVAPGAAGAEETAARSLYREHRDYLGELLAPWDLRPHPRGRADHAALAPLLVTQAAAAAGAGRAVRDAAARGELWGTEEDVLASLAHMTVNRLLPVDLSREERIYGVWKNVLRTIGGRPA
ncbi:lantibiotic dehydratase [Streptomyces coeruleorubidus]|uniref:lantibiotic dehydratase n=1 Tax=Streptomyces coeruleorubidus TaxID=116188 RepID=UPI00340B24CE